MDSYQNLWGDDIIPDAQLLIAADELYDDYVSRGGAQLFTDDSYSPELSLFDNSNEPDYNPTSPCRVGKYN